MHHRTLALLAGLLLLHAVGGSGPDRLRTTPGRPDAIHAGYQQPLPFLGSAGTLAPAVAVVATSSSPAHRNDAATWILRPRCAHGPQREAADSSASASHLRAGVSAGLLGTPPPAPRPGPIV